MNRFKRLDKKGPRQREVKRAQCRRCGTGVSVKKLVDGYCRGCASFVGVG